MEPTYNSLLLEGLFFPLLNFSLPFFYFPSSSFVPYFFSFFLFVVFPTFSPFFYFYFYFIFIINGLCISLLHRQYTFLYIFFIILFKIYKNMCKEMCTNHYLFFLLVNINLNHNVILYFFITLLILYW